MRPSLAAFPLFILSFFSEGDLIAEEKTPAEDPFNGSFIELEPLVVTARKREEPFQKVPANIRVFSEIEIEKGRIFNIDDLGFLTPSLTYIDPANPVETPLIIRGIGVSYGIGDYSVGVFLDGVYQGADTYYARDLFDVARIEILKGPQSALYGKNTTGGALQIITHEPLPKREVKTGTTFGGHGYIRESLMLNEPLFNGRILARAVWNFTKFDGFYTNQYNGEARDSDEQNSLRLKFKARFTDALSFLPSFSYRKRKMDSWFYHRVANDHDYTGQSYDVDRPSFAFIEAFSAALTANYEFPDGFRLTSISAWDRVKENDLVDIDYGSAPPDNLDPFSNIFIERGVNRESFSQEIRLSSPEYEKLNWLAGIFAYYLKDEFEQKITFDTLVSVPQPPGLNSTTDAYTYSLFGQFNVFPTEKLEIGIGLRYDYDIRQQNNNFGGGKEKREIFGAFSPKVTASYAFSPQTLLYASWAVGFKAGGFNEGEFPPFEKEKSTSYEFGLKTQLFQQKLQLNSAFFLTLVEDQQIVDLDIGSLSEFLTNKGKARVYGVEFDLTAQLSERFNFNLAFTAMSARFVDVSSTTISPLQSIGQFDFSGKRLPYVTDYEIVLGGEYHYPLKGNGRLTGRIDVRAAGKKYWDQFNTASQKPYQLVNATLEFEKGRYAVSAFVENLFKEEYFTNFVPSYRFPFAASALGVNGRPRFFGITLKASF